MGYRYTTPRIDTLRKDIAAQEAVERRWANSPDG